MPFPRAFALKAIVSLLSLTAGPALAQDIDPQTVLAQVAQDEAAVSRSDTKAIAAAPRPDWAVPSDPLDVPVDAQGLAFFRKQDTYVHVSDEGQRFFSSQLIRLLQPQALQLGNIVISWNPAAGEAQIHALRIHRGSRVIDVLEANSFEILRREDQLEQAMLDGTLTASLRVPDLRVGDDLEIEYSTPLNDPTLRDTASGLLVLADSPPQGRFRLELSWEGDSSPVIKPSPDLEGFVTRDKNRFALQLDNPETITTPRWAPARYGWTRAIEFSDFADWQQVSRRFSGLFQEAGTLGDGSPLKQEIALIAKDHASDQARMQAALELVQQQVRYVYVGLNGGNYTPASADETWERRYGDCKGKTVMLLALLDALGIEVEPVLVSNALATDGLDERLPNPAYFDHVLVRARIDGTDYWLDGTLPKVIAASQKPFLNYRWVLPLTQEGHAIERLPASPYTLPQKMGLIEIDARAGFDAPARKISTVVLRGVEAIQQHNAFTSITSQQLETALRSQLAGSATWSTVEDVEYRFDRDTQAGILTIEGTGPVDWDDEGEGAYSLTLPGGGFSPPEPRQRPGSYKSGSDKADAPFAQDFGYTCYVTTVRLPDGTDLSDWEYNSTFDTMMFGAVYYRMMERRDDRTIRMVRGNRVEQAEISPARAERDNGRLTGFDNSMARIYYTPGANKTDSAGQTSVPATYETDWAARGAPCLPADMVPK